MARLCAIEQAVGGPVGPCVRGRCPFWEPGGAVLPGRCAFEDVDLEGRPDVARELLAVRERLESPEDGDPAAVLHQFRRLLNEGDSD